jgi:phenylacetate-CoA ligase
LFDKAGIKPEDIQSIDDLHKIPITTKQDLKNLSENEIIAKGVNFNNCIVKNTSGSTGHPLKIFLSHGERDFHILLNLRILMENGLRLTDKMAYIINPFRFPKSKYWFQHTGILRREYLSVFDFPQIHVEHLVDSNPDVIYGYPSNLTLLALYIKEKQIRGIKPRIMFSIAEALEPKAKETIESIMNLDTCDILGTIELGDIAWQCEKRKGYHISVDAVIVEFLRDGVPVNAGEEGQTVCTSLIGYTMPLIRYAVNDICVPSDRVCTCGRTLPMMENIKGRANDFIVLPDGQIIASCFLVIVMQAYNNVSQYKVIQDQKDRLTVQVVRGEVYQDSTSLQIKRDIEKAAHGKLDVAVEIVKEIQRDPSGKIRTVVSNIIPGLQHHITQETGTCI